MKQEQEQDLVLKVQAFVDGELPETEQGAIAALIARDADVAGLVKELKQTRQALAGFDGPMPLPESREFYWSRIQREIARFPREESEAGRVSVLAVLLRWCLPATCVGALVAAGFLFLRSPWGAGDQVTWQAAQDNISAFTYRDYEEGMTVMWLSYPTDNAVANSSGAATLN
jgi:anti-sigma factor RsiW